ncbi:family 16 glycosylhydrolase [Belliella marina]|uniref:Family 16 glycosylhydrolase n=1 Tax=Belliella marina TaxID=1644146 RepID=A0ABW4VLZ1_9BACT
MNLSTKYDDIIVLGFLSVLFLYSCDTKIEKTSKNTSPYPGYELVWQDEFDTEGKPNPDDWSFESGFVRNHELQWYQQDNANIKDGVLVIEGRRDSIPNPNYDPQSKDWKKSREYGLYSSSSINTAGKQTFQYGIIEVKAKIDTAMGMWPAIWTLGVDKGWPANGEVDIMEYYRVKGEGTILANAAWAHESKRAAWDEAKIPFRDFLEKDAHWPEKFHTWVMEWTPENIRLSLDGELLNEIDLSLTLNPDGFNPFHQPHYILLNLAIGGNGGDPTETAFPKTYEVDYVRVYQQVDSE